MIDQPIIIFIDDTAGGLEFSFESLANEAVSGHQNKVGIGVI